jgi:hypothetical protein
VAKTKITRYCEWCKGPIKRKTRTSDKYCSRKCFGAARTIAARDKILGPGKYFEAPAPPGRNVKGPCWIWQGRLNPDGYGQAAELRRRGLPGSAHAVAYVLLKGPVPKGLELDHLCRVRACINPDHLEPVTHHENMRRGVQATKTHCKRGHEFTPENTKITINQCGNPGRACLACAKIAEEKRYTKHPRPPATHCANGHPFDEHNTHLFTDKKGKLHRQCLACHREYDKRRNRRSHRRKSATALG